MTAARARLRRSAVPRSMYSTDWPCTYHFQFGFRGEPYEIPLSASLLHAASQTQPLDAPSASVGSVDRRGPRKRIPAKVAAQEACTRYTLLLKTLFEMIEAAHDDSRTLARRLSARAVISSALPPSPGTITASAVAQQLEDLLDRESECKRASRRVYKANAQIGDSFVRLVAQGQVGLGRVRGQPYPVGLEECDISRQCFYTLDGVSRHSKSFGRVFEDHVGLAGPACSIKRVRLPRQVSVGRVVP
ncbi:hypothetical protein L1887_57302 [Cichorium endivia]|nr:hypothetical protein L1887_57302 [Cichorium endivia]